MKTDSSLQMYQVWQDNLFSHESFLRKMQQGRRLWYHKELKLFWVEQHRKFLPVFVYIKMLSEQAEEAKTEF